jgi:SAM-dependent methyltransferase
MIARWAALHDRRILEVGCGLGMYTAQYRRRFTPRVDAFDVEFPRVAQARESTPHALLAAGEGMPYRTDSFDVVISNEVSCRAGDAADCRRDCARLQAGGGS